jgi:hypothetical protein
MSQVAQVEGEAVEANATQQTTTAEFEDQGEAFSRAIEREFRQVLALVALAEREQELAATVRYRQVLVFASYLVLGSVLSVAWELGVDDTLGVLIPAAVFFAVATALCLVVLRELGRELHKHKDASGQVGETIREVVSTSDWQSKLDPLDWAHLRTRIASLDLVDLSSLK